jgi:signal transduction histidine kinase
MKAPTFTIRTRLTILLTVLFLAFGGALLALNYTLVADRLPVRIGYDGASIPPTSLQPEDLIVVTDADVAADPGELVPDLLDAVERGRERTLDELVRQSLVAMAIATLASIGIAWLVAGRLLRPVHRITATARRINDGNLDERIALDGPRDELRELADTFDDMLGRLDHAVRAQRRLIANAAHELRTPLANQRTIIEVALDDPDATTDDLRQMAEVSLRQVERSQRLIDALLRLARIENHPLETTEVDLAQIVREVITSLDHGDRTIELDLHPVPLLGDPTLLERLAANLIENAVRHNLAGGYVRIRTRDGQLAVVNSGPTVEPDEVHLLFEPFRRRSVRTGGDLGLGLGLALVSDIVKVHHGRIDARPGPDGGLDIRIDLGGTTAGAARTDVDRSG